MVDISISELNSLKKTSIVNCHIRLYFYKNFVIRDNLPNFRSTENKNYRAGLGALMLICVALLSIEEQAFVQMG